MTDLQDCDCLNECGDDNRLTTGQVKACAYLLKIRADVAEKKRITNMINEFADTSVEKGCITISSKDINDIRNLIVGIPKSE